MSRETKTSIPQTRAPSTSGYKPRRRDGGRSPGPGVIAMQGAVERYIDELREDGGLKGSDIANIADVVLPLSVPTTSFTLNSDPTRPRLLKTCAYGAL